MIDDILCKKRTCFLFGDQPNIDWVVALTLVKVGFHRQEELVHVQKSAVLAAIDLTARRRDIVVWGVRGCNAKIYDSEPYVSCGCRGGVHLMREQVIAKDSQRLRQQADRRIRWRALFPNVEGAREASCLSNRTQMGNLRYSNRAFEKAVNCPHLWSR